MHTHSPIRLLLCLLIVGAHIHCVMAHGAALMREGEASRCAEPPVNENEPCENESGCICRGALISTSIPAFLDDGGLMNWLTSITRGLDSCGVAPVVWFGRLAPHPAPPPLGGTAARIVLRSLQI